MVAQPAQLLLFSAFNFNIFPLRVILVILCRRVAQMPDLLLYTAFLFLFILFTACECNCFVIIDFRETNPRKSISVNDL